ncbi:hypothetical protein RRG08_030303 [Elysia crispata]|uniref:Uncharacterized protein n=1 Tax=Elysia crispata TaxID=231223 RepID=A0AAE0YIS5_9GAST|nr:hypothetical protein RRG08_030303 [Elysia crispata]
MEASNQLRRYRLSEIVKNHKKSFWDSSSPMLTEVQVMLEDFSQTPYASRLAKYGKKDPSDRLSPVNCAVTGIGIAPSGTQSSS